MRDMTLRPYTRRSRGGFTLPELMIAMAAGAILMLVAGTMWIMMHTEARNARIHSECSRTAFAVLRRVEEEVMRAQEIEVPDPDYMSASSMQVRIPDGAGTVRRAFRLDGDTLVIEWKDESGLEHEAFENISALTFALVDAPTNSQVRISCTATIEDEQVQMTTVATKRN